MIARDRPLAYGWHANRFTCASLGLYIEAVVPSAGDGEPGDKNRTIKRLKNICIFGNISWIRRFCQGFFPFFSMTLFCYLPQKSPRATFCNYVHILLSCYWIVCCHFLRGESKKKKARLQDRISPPHSSGQLAQPCSLGARELHR